MSELKRNQFQMNPDKMYHVFFKKIKAFTNLDMTNFWDSDGKGRWLVESNKQYCSPNSQVLLHSDGLKADLCL